MTVKIRVKDKLEDDTLDLSCCDLEEVPVKEIATIKKGTHLDLSNNQLVKLPETFLTLTHILKLDLSKNLLEELPENIGDLKQLKHLDLYSNKISRLPLSFGELKNLKWLDLKDNPLNEVLSVLAGPCSDNEQCQNCACHVISYYINVKETIEKKKELAMIAAVAEERKRDAKRKKKKRKNASKDSNNTNDEKDKVAPAKSEKSIINNDAKNNVSESNPKLQATDNESLKGRRGLCSTFCHVLFSLLFGLLFLAIVFVLVVTIWSKYDEKRSDKLVQYLETQTSLPVKIYQQLGIKQFDSFVGYFDIFMHHTRILVRDTYQRHFGEVLIDADDTNL